jgi:hypothetical protein
VEPAKVTTPEARIVDFPKNLSFSEEEIASFKAVHKLLANLDNSLMGMRDTDTFAQQHKLENLKAHVLRFQWLLGSYGKFESTETPCLVVDAETYLANRGSEKTLAIWSFVEDTVFKVLSEYGVCCERVAKKGTKTEKLTTGTGYLRSKGWVMKMSFEERIGGTVALKALQTYARRLDEKYGKKAFQHFRSADMQFLFET